MNSPISRETAIILQFPPPGRRVRAGQISQANRKQIVNEFEAPTCVSGGAWYHEAAIVEAERPRKS